ILTQWTAHYLAFRQLLDLKFALNILIRQEKDSLRQGSKIVTSDTASQKKATEMPRLTEDPVMW
ncbi:hypothetical protein BDR04DRAFT_982006, partial [Suillus decipiens]